MLLSVVFGGDCGCCCGLLYLLSFMNVRISHDINVVMDFKTSDLFRFIK